jgi:tetratricopeptide (TPR) repeat protein
MEETKLEGKMMKRVCIVLLLLGFATALAAQQKALKTYITEAQALQGEGKLREGIDLLKEAVSVYPEETNAYLQLGLAWGALGQKSGETGDFTTAMNAVNEGFVAFEKAVELDPGFYEAHFYYGVYGVNVPSLFGKLDPGVEHLEKALAILKARSGEDQLAKLAVVYQYLGKGYQMQERMDEAREAWEKALAISPEGEVGDAARAGLESLERAKVSAETKKMEKKKESQKVLALKEKLKESPEDFESNYKLGKAYFDEGNWVEAQKFLRKAVALDGNHFEAQFLLAKAVMEDGTVGYDERIYEDQALRTNLAFEMVRQLERTLELDPTNLEARLWHATSCVMMPFFVQRIDQGIAGLEEIASDEGLPDEVRAEALYHLGFGYRKKGNAIWMKLMKDYPRSEHIQGIYDEYGLREYGEEKLDIDGEKVIVTFHLGFMDELAPQTGIWVEDADGRFVKTLYVSGFSSFAKEKQVNLPVWSKSSEFETDGTTGASIDWGKHTYSWDLTDHGGNRVRDGLYKVYVEVAWWPSMKYGRASAEIRVGTTPDEVTVDKAPFVPLLHVRYVR